MKSLRLSALVAAVCFALAAPATTAAQEARDPQDYDYSESPAIFWDRLELQLTQSLGSQDSAMRAEAARLVVYFASFYPEQAHFDRAAPKLMDMYQFSHQDSHRMIALAALDAIGDENAMAYLSQIVHRERHPVVRKIAIAALVDYQKRETL